VAITVPRGADPSRLIPGGHMMLTRALEVWPYPFRSPGVSDRAPRTRFRIVGRSSQA